MHISTGITSAFRLASKFAAKVTSNFVPQADRRHSVFSRGWDLAQPLENCPGSGL